jgi:hypothetical protein
MKTNIKSFSQFINENHEDPDGRAELADLANLYSLRMIDDGQYGSDVIRILKSMGVISSSEPRVSRQESNRYDPEWADVNLQWHQDVAKKNLNRVANNFKGPNGERIIEIESSIEEETEKYDKRITHVLLNTGIDVLLRHAPNTGSWINSSIDITAGDQTFTKDDLPIDFEDPENEWHYDGPEFYFDNEGLSDLLYVICEEYGILAIDALVKKSM